jgi:hypothetical protein
LVGVSWASPAAACTIQGPPLSLSGYPEDGAVGVPTDVLPLYDTTRLGYPDPVSGSPAEFRLLGADGVEIPIVMSSPYTGNISFTPEAELAPNSAYTFEATAYAHSAAAPTLLLATFTTGDGRAASPSVVEGAFMDHFLVDLAGRPYSSCGVPLSGTCVVVPPGSFVSAVFVDEFGQEQDPYLYREPFFANLSGIEQGTSFICVRLRTRAPNGAESDPIELCGEDAPLLDYTGSNTDVKCTATGVAFEPPPTAGGPDHPSSNESGGCAVSSRSPRQGAAWLALGALLGLAVALRNHAAWGPRSRRRASCRASSQPGCRDEPAMPTISG